MLHKSGALESTSTALKRQHCIRMGHWNPPVWCGNPHVQKKRWIPSLRRWNLNAPNEWGAGLPHYHTGTRMLQKMKRCNTRISTTQRNSTVRPHPIAETSGYMNMLFGKSVSPYLLQHSTTPTSAPLLQKNNPAPKSRWNTNRCESVSCYPLDTAAVRPRTTLTLKLPPRN